MSQTKFVMTALMAIALSLCAVDATSQESLRPPGVTWTRVGEFPTPICWSSATIHQGALYVAGGLSPRGATASAWKLSPDSRSWEPVPPLSRPRFGHRLVSHEGRLWSIGGKSSVSAYIDSVEWLDEATGRWLTTGCLPSLPSPRAFFCAASTGSKLYLIGGESNDYRSTEQVLLFDPSADAWKRTVDYPIPISHCESSVMDGRVIVVGGTTHSEQPTNEVYAFDGSRWTPMGPMRIPRSDPLLITHAGSLFAFGGTTWHPRVRDSISETANETEILHVLSERPTGWEILAEDSWIRRSAMSGAIVGSTIFSVGGIEPSGLIVDEVDAGKVLP